VKKDEDHPGYRRVTEHSSGRVMFAPPPLRDLERETPLRITDNLACSDQQETKIAIRVLETPARLMVGLLRWAMEPPTVWHPARHPSTSFFGTYFLPASNPAWGEGTTATNDSHMREV